jgi:hypothetical protein
MLGHTAKSVRARHYMAMDFERQARALARLILVLPDRDGVVARAAESSSESSSPPRARQRHDPHWHVASYGNY